MPRADGHASGEKVFLTRDEFASLLDAFPDHYRPFVLTLAGTGMRFGEATALRVGDVDLARRRVHIERAWKRQPDGTFKVGPPKSVKSVRTIEVPPSVIDAVRPLTVGRRRDEYVFITPRGSHIRHSNFTNWIWAPAVSESVCCRKHRAEQRPADASRYWQPEPCGCDGYLDRRPSPHDMRHTCASWLLAAGIPISEVQQRLGHESINTTVGTYGHLAPDAGARSAHALEAILG